jgi:hypothetical protein
MPCRTGYRLGRKVMHRAQRFPRFALPAVAVAASVLVTRLVGPSHDIPFTLFTAAVS